MIIAGAVFVVGVGSIPIAGGINELRREIKIRRSVQSFISDPIIHDDM